MLWGDAVESLEPFPCICSATRGNWFSPSVLLGESTAFGKLWAHHGTCSAHTLGSLHTLPMLLHSPICAVPLGRPRPVSLYGCASSREKALGSPACPCTLLPAWDCSPPDLSWFGSGIAAIPPALLQHEGQVHCPPLHKPCCRRTGSPISQLQSPNTQKLGWNGRTPISRLFPSTGPCSQHHRCDHATGCSSHGPRDQHCS